MDVYASSDEDYHYDSDHEDSVEAYENDENYALLSSKGTTTKVITKESLLAAQKEDLRRVMDMLSVREQHARTLLIFHRWDVENLFEVLVDKGKSFLFAEAGVSVDEHRNSDSPVPPAFMCYICMEEVPSSKTTRMDCGHCFCNGCWIEHFIVKINEGQSKRIRCMEHKCNSICDDAVVRTLLSREHPHMAEKYERFLLESYIEDNKRVKWCPSTPHCGNAIRVEDDELCEVECSCGVQFCFSCLSEAHSPCSCLMWELWAKKCRDESETVNWITVHTKPCPKCHKPVEKNGGCNLVSCICGQAFCWLCGGATGREHTWSSIAGHSCGRYKEQEKTAERAKRDLYRYMHYHNRYKAHTDSFKIESKLKETIQGKISISEEKDSTLRDYSWDEMTDAQREIKQNLFEDQQQQLEANVEKLSKILEEPFETFSDDKVVEIRMQILNLSTIIDKLCQKMYECIENDLLGSLNLGIHSIAPYKSKGIERASELSVGWNNKVNNTGVTEELDRPSGSGSSDDNGCSSRKRARKEGLGGGGFFDLNLPAEFVDRN
ncbi:Putative E3 ubiquitin-protein ligase ARI1 [Glycine soja]|uniref:RBR-type E3 ubiquitin transferase n=1 Tax=Glycine soja TaxID=3848 RepID=A0A0B2PF42_GLYSO|nr:Putative E3 ubiquitin-protein ligase ARI1 [Glycine soja]